MGLSFGMAAKGGAAAVRFGGGLSKPKPVQPAMAAFQLDSDDDD